MDLKDMILASHFASGTGGGGGDLSNYYTKTQSNSRFALKGDSYTKLESDDKYAIKDDLGELADLETTDKSSIVAAINEVNAKGGLSTEAKTALLNCFAHTAWIDEHGQDYYDALAEALGMVKHLVSISAVFTQGATVVYPSTSLDSLKSMLVVTALYDDESTETVSDYTLSGVLTEGTSTVTVTYESKTTTFSVAVSAEPIIPVLDHISAVYSGGDVAEGTALDTLKSNLVVTAHYTDSTTQTVASADYTLSGTIVVGSNTITVTYSGKTTTFTVTGTPSAQPVEFEYIGGISSPWNAATYVTTDANNIAVFPTIKTVADGGAGTANTASVLLFKANVTAGQTVTFNLTDNIQKIGLYGSWVLDPATNEMITRCSSFSPVTWDSDITAGEDNRENRLNTVNDYTITVPMSGDMYFGVRTTDCYEYIEGVSTKMKVASVTQKFVYDGGLTIEAV